MKYRMRMMLWYVWCMILGGILSALGVHIVDHPFWFLAIDSCFIAASVNAVKGVWPNYFAKDEEVDTNESV